MTWRSAICFSVVGFLMVAEPAGSCAAGTVTGQIRLINSGISAGKRLTDFSGVVVWLISADPPSAPAGRKHALIVQKDKTFSPHILVITTGTVVDFPNLDPIFHNAFSNFEGKIFDLSLYAPGSSRSIRFDRPGIVRVFCNIHPAMSAIIVVVNSPYFALTKRDGSFSIPDVTPDEYQIHFFYERATPEALHELTVKISVDAQLDRLAPVTISEAGYLPVAHKNKYGRDYPPGSDESQYAWPLK